MPARATVARSCRAAPLLLAGLLFGCAPEPPPKEGAGGVLPGGDALAPPPAAADVGHDSVAGFDPGPLKTAAEYLAEPRFAAADLRRGELLSLACAACHTFGAGQAAMIGPNLHAVFGRPAGAGPGFEYSAALRGSGIVWTPQALEAWLADPARFVQGTTMAFTGYRAADERRDLIAYLLAATQ